MSWRRWVVTAAVLAGGVSWGPDQACRAAEVPSAPGSQRTVPVPSSGIQLMSMLEPPQLDHMSSGQVVSRIRATVNGVPILDEEVREAIYPLLAETLALPEPERLARQKEIYERELQRLIEREVVLQDANALLKKRPQLLEKMKQAAGKEFEKQIRSMKKRNNIQTDEELKAILRMQGLTLESARRQAERNFIAMEYLRSRIFPAVDRISPEDIIEFYEKNPGEFEVPDAVHWQDIFIDAGRYPTREAARQVAQEIAVKARAGQDFVELANRYDNGDSSYRNGEGVGQRRGEIKPIEAEGLLFQMRDGEVGVVEIGSGYHVIRLVKRQYAGRLPLDEKVQAAIRNKLTNQIWEREYKRILSELKRKAAIEISAAAP